MEKMDFRSVVNIICIAALLHTGCIIIYAQSLLALSAAPWNARAVLEQHLCGGENRIQLS